MIWAGRIQARTYETYMPGKDGAMLKEERLERERERIRLMREAEQDLSGGAAFVFGIDEAGRGPLCGPVAAACVILDRECEILYLNDSKKLAEKKREKLYEEITAKALAYGIALIDEKRIDEINILNATMEAMHDAFDKCMSLYRERTAEKFTHLGHEELRDAFDYMPGVSDSIVLIDGNRTVPQIMYRQKAVVKGDALCPSISAASILAKVTRDRLLMQYDRLYPGYGFARNKGYGTKEHIDAIKKYGILDIHRKTFLKKL